VAWWKEPAETLSKPDDFLCRVMLWGTWEDWSTMLAQHGREAFRHALEAASLGVLDLRSWIYWRGRLGLPEAPPPVRYLA